MSEREPDDVSCTSPQNLKNSLELGRTPEAGGLARRFLEEHYYPHLSPTAFSHARLVATELVNNAVVHGEGRIVLNAVLADGTLRLEVVDEGTGEAPGIREQAREDGGGWGLRIVDTLSTRWGAFEGTTHVWAEIPAR